MKIACGVLLGVLVMVCDASAAHYWQKATGTAATCGAGQSATKPVADSGFIASPMTAAACLAGSDTLTMVGETSGTTARIFEPTISVANGVAGNHTIIEGEGLPGCALASTCSTKLKPTGSSSSNLENPSYITLRNFEIDHTNASAVNNACLRVNGTGTNILLENMHLHHCYGDGVVEGPLMSFLTYRFVHIDHAGRLDTNGVNPAHGSYLNGDDTLIEYSRIHDCGPDNGDHNNNGAVQIYNSSASSDGRADRPIIRYSEFYACDYGVIVEGNDAQVYGNLIRDNLSDGLDFGHDGAMRAKAHNNTIYNNAGNGLYMGIFTGLADNGEIINNHFAANGTNITIGAGNTGTTQSNNRTTGAITDCTVSTSNFRHKAGSSCIDAGTAVSTRSTFNGSAPDIGAFEAFVFATCSVEDGDASTLRVTFANDVFPPLLPASSVTGFTARLDTASNVITAASRTATNRIDLTLTNAVTTGDAVDVSYSGGNLTDSALIGGTLNQTYVQSLSQQSCTNNVAGSIAALLTQTAFRFHGLRGTEAAPIIKPHAASAVSTSTTSVPGGKIRVRLKVACTGGDCDPLGMALRYSKNGGAYTVVPDTFDADNIQFFGTGPDPDIPASGTATTELLTSGHETDVACAIIRTSNAVPTVDLSEDSEAECEYAIQLDSDVTPGDTYDFRLYDQGGAALSAYSVTPRVTVTAMSAAGGF